MKKIEALLYSNGKPLSIEIDNGYIKKIDYRDDTVAGKNIYIAPGFIDNQVNGYLGVDFTSADLKEEELLKVVTGLQKKGVTSFLPAVITASEDILLASFKNLAKALNNPKIEAAVPGFHLEGPYISPLKGYRGAHNPQYIRPPDWVEFCRLNDAAEGKILQVTLAPELDGAIEFIEKCTERGITVSLGHHNASTEQIKKAVDAGARAVTHLGNGCANTIHRFENPLWPQLAEDRLTASIIADGHHLQEEQLKVFYRSKTAKRLILTSDVTMLGGLPPGSYIWNGKEVVLEGSGVIRYTQENCFGGASLPLLSGVNNMIRYAGCSLAEAIDMVTANPAALYGFEDRGRIKTGTRADLILFSVENRQIVMQKVVFSGQEV
ncbi:MAG TPA: N-acetylglucosamine-6-phosphate deacetylase [Caldithrix abyssi]|uniref:N-acetylglucosamine-6-phosphate deacetylase n=1 Tax=Caldithrix abyssi TaxID=187145 RepID=A0A7V4TZN3_CALAY|nr:N-acetylglucosamine-6-phosphate deacetylase [Caldithrix abyssi]